MIEANCELETERTGENQEIVGLGVGGEQSGGREVMTCEYRLDLLTNLREDYAKFYKHGEGHKEVSSHRFLKLPIPYDNCISVPISCLLTVCPQLGGRGLLRDC